MREPIQRVYWLKDLSQGDVALAGGNNSLPGQVMRGLGSRGRGVRATVSRPEPRGSPDEPISKARATASRFKMRAAHVDLGKDILEAQSLAPGIDVATEPVDPKAGDPLVNPLRHTHRMGPARRLKDVAALSGGPSGPRASGGFWS